MRIRVGMRMRIRVGMRMRIRVGMRMRIGANVTVSARRSARRSERVLEHRQVEQMLREAVHKAWV